MSTRIKSNSKVIRERSNNAGTQVGILNRILSKISIFRSISSKRKNHFISNSGIFKIKMLLISEEVDREYKVYKANKTRYRKSSRIAKHFSFYNHDGSFNCLGILLGMCSDDVNIRDKAIRLFFSNMEKITSSEEFRDLVTFIFSCSVFIYLYCDLFFNVTEFVKYNLGLIL